MQSFLEYWLNEAKEEPKETKSLSSFSAIDDLSFRNGESDEYLKRCLKWLMGSEDGKKRFPFILQIDVSRDSNVGKVAKRGGGRIGYLVEIYSSSATRSVRQNEALNLILGSFSDGPLIVKNPEDSNDFEFLWYANADKIEDEINKLEKNVAEAKKDVLTYSNFSIAVGRNMLDNLIGTGGSKNSRYSVGYYSIVGAKQPDPDKLPFLKREKGKREITLESLLKEDSNVEIEAKCIIDFTVKTQNKLFGTRITDSGKLLDIIGKQIGVKDGSFAGMPYQDIKAFDDLSNLNERISTSISASNDMTKEDKGFYAALFNEILSKKEQDTFDLSKFKTTTLAIDDAALSGISLKEMLGEPKYGAVVAELLPPFLLLAGYSKITPVGGSSIDIIEGNEEKISMIQYPKSNKNVLTDYNVVFAVTESGKTYAVSAKFSEGSNAPSLFTLIDNNRKIFANEKNKEKPKIKNKSGNSTFDEIAAKNADLSAIGDCITPSMTLLEEVKAAGEKIIPEELTEKKIDEYLESNYSGEKIKALKKDMEAASALVADKKLSEYLNKKDDFLSSVYEFMFGYYGQDIPFKQIELMPNLTVRYIQQEKISDKKDISKKIKIYSSSGLLNGKVNLKQPVRVKLL